VRKAVLIPLLTLALGASASAAAQERPYQQFPTRRCLIRHGAQEKYLSAARENRLGFGQRWNAFTWNASGRFESITRASTDLIGIEFAPNPARGLASERRVRHILHAYYGYSAAWIRRHLMRRENVVVVAYTFYSPLTAGQRRLIVGCLRG
jgi:hypothetical protein